MSLRVLIVCCLIPALFSCAHTDKKSEPTKAPKAIGDMVLIPAGKFWMGCNEKVDSDCASEEKPYHEVYLDAYYIDKHEVTVGDYRKCVTSGRCEAADAFFRDCNWKYSDRDNHPINCVDWHRAKAYCEWKGGRLPTEAEWEKAARGTDGRIYPWGNEKATCSRAVMNEGGEGCGRDSTWPVCSKPAGNSPYGLCDMAGNVWEWVNDWYDSGYYKNSPARNPKGANSGDERVLRGGSWLNTESWILRASYRGWNYPDDSSHHLGFRCVRSSRQ